jgi:hypothetical protein
MLTNQAVDKYVIPWASEEMDAARASILSTNEKLLWDSCQEAEQHAITDAYDFYTSTLHTGCPEG